MNFNRVIILLMLVITGIYLFVSAPQPLAENSEEQSGTMVPIAKVFDAANALNAIARRIYTKRIVTAGIKGGLKFDEDWREKHIEAGPLPALFLRLVAAQLETKPTRLSLYLGSDKPINASNLFTGNQANYFQQLKSDQQPRYFDAINGNRIAMYADFASVQGCVTCHNEHKDTPKKDWKLNDIMGATTWSHPKAQVNEQEFIRTLRDLYASINEAYAIYLKETHMFSEKPLLGDQWPGEGIRALPTGKVFEQALLDASGATIVREMVLGEGS